LNLRITIGEEIRATYFELRLERKLTEKMWIGLKFEKE
jgi:hypothetical protein